MVRRVTRPDDRRWDCADCGHVQGEHENLRDFCWHVTLDGKDITDRCECPTFTPRPDYPLLTRGDTPCPS